MLSNLALLALLPITSAHFLLTWPPARGFDDDKAVNFPCGGFDTVSKTRTSWPAVGAPIQLDMHHTQTDVMVLLSLGSDPGVNYNIILRPTFEEEGLGNFCMGQVSLPEGVNFTEGQEATIQVVSNGDPDGGLYQCADITLTKTALSTTDYNTNCKNNTGVKVSTVSGSPLANTTNPEATGAVSSKSASGSATAASATATSTGMAPHQTMAAWALGGMAVVGALAGL
ncbi:hypothetical protein BU16DRAFT_523918 [Lophium mytilinum]|uniref:Copper acquisition factor BIM1-like domain-containing protein n=1 Tax=Lophium mytilinum TaxID=390894 RepID=A0A6A6R7H6_9PEZI|nr:hypothetical protein BU16DRAFT_523918 [Lophium mytilinum]